VILSHLAAELQIPPVLSCHEQRKGVGNAQAAVTK
jgi:hypothetical protein